MKYKLCDIHAHIVPAIDDGAHNLQASIEILEMASRQGVNSIICTSHHYGRLELYNKHLKVLQNEAQKKNIKINLYPGCEIYCSKNNIQNIINKLQTNYIPTINKSKYILVEFDPSVDINEIIYCTKQLIKCGYKPIIAHVERYYNLFINNKYILLQTTGCLFQVNAYSLQDARETRIKAFARKLLKEKLITFIGSDAHDINYRPYIINNGVDYIYEHCDIEYAKDICYRNAESILNIS